MLLYDLEGLEISKPIEVKIPVKIKKIGILNSEMKTSHQSLGSDVLNQNQKYRSRLLIDVFTSDAQENVFQDRFKSKILFNPDSFPSIKEKTIQNLLSFSRVHANQLRSVTDDRREEFCTEDTRQGVGDTKAKLRYQSTSSLLPSLVVRIRAVIDWPAFMFIYSL